MSFRYVDQNVPAGDYQYRAAAINDGDQGTFGGASGTAQVSAGAPTAVDTRLTVNGGQPFSIDNGDSFTIAASADLTVAANAALRLQDSDGTVSDLTRGTNSTFTLNTAPVDIGGTTYPAGRVITVAITGAPTPVQAGDIAGQGIPSNITNESGITGRGGDQLQLTGGDVTIDQDRNTTTGGGGNGQGQAATFQSATPANNATNVPVNANPTATYGTAPGAGSTATLTGPNNAVVPGTAAVNGNDIVFTPTNPLAPNTAYTATFTPAGGTATPVNFTTAAAQQQTAVFQSSAPADNDVNVPVGTNPTATYDVAPGAGSTATLVDNAGVAVPGTVTVNGNDIVFTPTAPLTAATQYTATFTPAGGTATPITFTTA